MQTILGAGGSIGIELALALPKYTNKIRLVGRRPRQVNAFDETFRADLLDPVQVMRAMKGTEVAYLTAGLKYDSEEWEAFWPLLMRNVITACKEHSTRLVFFDNMYMYDPSVMGHMTEESPVAPVSRKGKVRQQVADMVMEAHAKGEVKALIARSADFYGPGIRNSVLGMSVVDRLARGKKAQWFCSARHKHSFTYTPDAGRATAILGNESTAFGKVWHLPTAPDPLTGEEWVQAFAEEMGARAGVTVAGQTMIRLLGMFIPVLKEFRELTYQWDRDYIFDSTQFERRFSFRPTPYAEGIRAVAAAAQKH